MKYKKNLKKINALKLIKQQHNLIHRYTALLLRVHNGEMNDSIIKESEDLITETRGLYEKN